MPYSKNTNIFRKARKSMAGAGVVSTSQSSSLISAASPVFLPMIGMCLLLWFFYRSLFTFPVWFDELVGKALFFGLPVWLYVMVTGTQKITDTLRSSLFKRGLSLGLAVGGVLGFAASLLAIYQRGGGVQPAALFAADGFWWEFFLALLTGFWETLFFFSFVMIALQDTWKHWPLLKQVVIVAAVFVVFHLPNAILRFSGPAIMYQAILLFLFAIGQGFLFAREKNAYALILSHAIWGMVLLVHF